MSARVVCGNGYATYKNMRDWIRINYNFSIACVIGKQTDKHKTVKKINVK